MNTKYIGHAIIVVAFIILVGWLVYWTNSLSCLWLLLFIFLYQPWGNIKIKKAETPNEKQGN